MKNKTYITVSILAIGSFVSIAWTHLASSDDTLSTSGTSGYSGSSDATTLVAPVAAPSSGDGSTTATNTVDTAYQQDVYEKIQNAKSFLNQVAQKLQEKKTDGYDTSEAYGLLQKAWDMLHQAESMYTNERFSEADGMIHQAIEYAKDAESAIGEKIVIQTAPTTTVSSTGTLSTVTTPDDDISSSRNDSDDASSGSTSSDSTTFSSSGSSSSPDQTIWRQGRDATRSGLYSSGGTKQEEVVPVQRIVPDKVVSSPDRMIADSDGDGLSDSEENRLGTNPDIADSDGDGYLDAAEIRGGFNPLKFSSGDGGDRVVREDARSIPQSEREDKRYVVKDLEVVEKAKVGDEPSMKTLRLSGKALPNMHVTIYVYSTPIVVTVKADENGDWTYELDKDIEDGEHEAYVAVTDATGKITAKSEPIAFVKTAQAVSVRTAQASASAAANRSPLERSRTDIVVYGVLVATSFLVLAVAILGWLSRRHKRQIAEE